MQHNRISSKVSHQVLLLFLKIILTFHFFSFIFCILFILSTALICVDEISFFFGLSELNIVEGYYVTPCICLFLWLVLMVAENFLKRTGDCRIKVKTLRLLNLDALKSETEEIVNCRAEFELVNTYALFPLPICGLN